MKVLYISHKRRKERSALDAIDDVDLCEIGLCASRDGVVTVLRRWVACAEHLWRGDPDVALFEACGAGSLGPLLLCWLRRTPTAIRLKGDLWREMDEAREQPTLKGRLKRLLNTSLAHVALRRADAILPISRALRDTAIARLGGHRRYHIVHNVAETFPVRTPRRAPQDKYLLTVTNLNYWAKAEPLLRAGPAVVAALAAADTQWWIAGGGVFLAEFQRRASTWPTSVSVLGPRKDVADLYAHATAFFYASGLDGLPNVILEAYAARLPVVINSDCPAIECVRPDRTGLVVDLAKQEAVTSAVFRVLTDGALRTRLAEGGETELQTTFSLSRVASALRAALRDVAGNRANRGCPREERSDGQPHS